MGLLFSFVGFPPPLNDRHASKLGVTLTLVTANYEDHHRRVGDRFCYLTQGHPKHREAHSDDATRPHWGPFPSLHIISTTGVDRFVIEKQFLVFKF